MKIVIGGQEIVVGEANTLDGTGLIKDYTPYEPISLMADEAWWRRWAGLQQTRMKELETFQRMHYNEFMSMCGATRIMYEKLVNFFDKVDDLLGTTEGEDNG